MAEALSGSSQGSVTHTLLREEDRRAYGYGAGMRNPDVLMASPADVSSESRVRGTNNRRGLLAARACLSELDIVTIHGPGKPVLQTVEPR